MMDDGLKSQNGRIYPELDLVDPGSTKIIRGGSGELGEDNLGHPYPANTIGSGPRVETGPNFRGIRRGMSIEGNFERGRYMTDRNEDQERSYDRTNNR
jgi:hypothetical protein